MSSWKVNLIPDFRLHPFEGDGENGQFPTGSVLRKRKVRQRQRRASLPGPETTCHQYLDQYTYSLLILLEHFKDTKDELKMRQEYSALDLFCIAFAMKSSLRWVLSLYPNHFEKSNYAVITLRNEFHIMQDGNQVESNYA
jgi:hypothetical protein